MKGMPRKYQVPFSIHNFKLMKPKQKGEQSKVEPIPYSGKALLGAQLVEFPFKLKDYSQFQ